MSQGPNIGVHIAARSKRKIAIFDLDNCLANDEWRIEHIHWGLSNPDRRYADYHALCGFDAYANRDTVVECIAAGCEIFIFTARPASASAVTKEWLRRNRIKVAGIIMRNDGDHRPSALVKEEQLMWLVEHERVDIEDIEVAYDDRRDVLDMYKGHGIHALQLCCHDVCAMTPSGVDVAPWGGKS